MIALTIIGIIVAFMIGRSFGKRYVINCLIRVALAYPTATAREVMEACGVGKTWWLLQGAEDEQIKKELGIS
jgi:hypothetical protein